jgi:hypothetical protein
MIVASFGGGVNSTAMLIGMVERGEKCDLILFADTGGEKPHTYEHIQEFSKWLKFVGMPEITTVRSPNETLEASCLKLGTLPSIAYGFKTCSQRFKKEPQDKFLRAHLRTHSSPIRRADNGDGEMGGIIRLVGFDADEPHRAKDFPGNRYPLIEWRWGRQECIEAIQRAGQKVPDKSACFFCPSSKKHEIMELRRVYPDLAARAVAMEKNAELTAVKGLGRSFSWGDLYAADDAQMKMFPESPIEQACMCYDGE